jgi:hypothetical protein
MSEERIAKINAIQAILVALIAAAAGVFTTLLTTNGGGGTVDPDVKPDYITTYLISFNGSASKCVSNSSDMFSNHGMTDIKSQNREISGVLDGARVYVKCWQDIGRKYLVVVGNDKSKIEDVKTKLLPAFRQ